MLPCAGMASKFNIWVSPMYIHINRTFWGWGNALIPPGISINVPHHRFLMVFKLQHLLYYSHGLQNLDYQSTDLSTCSLGKGTIQNGPGEGELQPKYPRKAQYTGPACSHQILMGAVTGTSQAPGTSFRSHQVPPRPNLALWALFLRKSALDGSFLEPDADISSHPFWVILAPA